MHASRYFLTMEQGATGLPKQRNKPPKPGVSPEPDCVRGPSSASRSQQPLFDLEMSSRASLTDLAPGEIVFLDEFTHLRESFAPNFVAVLACPLCGAPGLITSAQYSGSAPIVCTSKVCSGLFRIVDESQIVSLPPS